MRPQQEHREAREQGRDLDAVTPARVEQAVRDGGHG